MSAYDSLSLPAPGHSGASASVPAPQRPPLCSLQSPPTAHQRLPSPGKAPAPLSLFPLLRLSFSPYLSPAGLERLRFYRYQTSSSSWLEDAVIEPIFSATLQLVPLWMAPNLLSLLALTACSCAYAVLEATTAPSAAAAGRSSPPAWALLLSAALMTAYQLLDGVDGKQARRTGSSSPLGQLFDHGVDSVAAVCNALCLVAVWGQLGTGWAWLNLLSACGAFFVSNWEEAVTGSMRFGVVGPTEGQIFVNSILIASAIAGPGLWSTPLLGISGLTVQIALTCAGFVFGILYQVCSSLLLVYRRRLTLSAECREEAGNRLMAYLAFLCLAVTVAASPDPAVSVHSCVWLWLIGLLSVYLSSRLVLCHVTEQPFSVAYPIVWPLPILALHLHLPCLPWLSTTEWAAAYLVCAAVAYSHLVYCTVNEICSHLHIRCFHIDLPTQDGTAELLSSSTSPEEAPL